MQEFTVYLQDVKNKLSVINLHCETLAKQHPEVNLRPILVASDHADEVLSTLLSSAKMATSSPEAILCTKAQDAFKDFQTIAGILRQIFPMKIDLHFDVSNSSAEFAYDTTIMSQVLENLFANSYKSGANRVSLVMKNNSSFISLVVTDRGPDGPLPHFVSNVRLPNSLGKNLVVDQLRKINAECLWTERDFGMSVIINFPIISQK